MVNVFDEPRGEQIYDDHFGQPMGQLVGKTILWVEMLGDEYIRFITSDGTMYHYRAEGDCCSHSWFAGLSNLPALLHHTVVKTEQLYLRSDEEDYGEIKYYGIKITTDAGACTLDFRNSSNGYYGGWVIYVKGFDDPAWKRITDDFAN